jgi:hypothetical protein
MMSRLFHQGRAQPELEEGDDGGDGLHQEEWYLEPHRSPTRSQAGQGEVGIQDERYEHGAVSKHKARLVVKGYA